MRSVPERIAASSWETMMTLVEFDLRMDARRAMRRAPRRRVDFVLAAAWVFAVTVALIVAVAWEVSR